MKEIMRLQPILAAAFLLIAHPATASDPCLDNFSADGNFFVGKTYKTWAMIPGIRQEDAFQRAYAFTAENGFSILSSDKAAGVISAAQSVSYGQGKTVPLILTFKDESVGTRIGLSYATSGGVLSPEDAIKNHFCLTIAAASEQGRGAQSASPIQVNSGPQATRPQHKVLPGFAMATPKQQQAIERAIPQSIPNERLRKMVAEASPAIAEYVGRLACLADHTGASALNEYAAPDTNLHNMYVGLRPMRTMQYHNKAACLNVSRIHGWSMPANNALKFEVVYKSEESGETSKLTHETIKQPDGSWLFSR